VTSSPARSRLASEPGTDLHCRARVDRMPCPHPPAWDLVLQCVHCGRIGAGHACSFHKGQAQEWGVPHLNAERQPCERWADLSIAVPL
jgi:hypothetical protein